jgi:AAA domain
LSVATSAPVQVQGLADLPNLEGDTSPPTDGSLAKVIELAAKRDEAPKTKPALKLVKASSLDMEIPEWAWVYAEHGRIPRAALTLFGGRPEAGKSTCARWFAAGWTHGTLPGCFEGKPVDVLYVATEEHWQSIVMPSLVAAGAAMDRIHFIQRGDDPARINSINDEKDLTALLQDNNIQAVFLDPLMGSIAGGADLTRTTRSANTSTRGNASPKPSTGPSSASAT